MQHDMVELAKNETLLQAVWKEALLEFSSQENTELHDYMNEVGNGLSIIFY